MKRTKKLLSMVCILVLLCGAAILATKLNPENKEAEEEPAVQIFSVDPETITALSWTYNEGDTLTFTRNGGIWAYEADTSFPLDESYLTDMTDVLTEIVALRTIEAPEDLAEYGLHRPVCTITVTAGDTTSELQIGDMTAVDGLQYFSIGDGKVYLVYPNVLEPFTYELLEMVQQEEIPDMSKLTDLSLTTAGQQMTLTYLENSGYTYSDSYVWFLESGGNYRTLDTELTAEFLQNLTSIQWNSCVSYDADSDDLARFALDEPDAVLSIGYVQEIGSNDETTQISKTFDLEISYANGTTYARIADSSMVYSIDAKFLNLLLYTTYADLKPDEVLLMDWDTVERITVTWNGTEYEIVKQNDATETIYSLNGEAVDFADILDDLDAMESTGYAGSADEADEEIRFTFHRNTQNFSKVTLSFCRYDSASCLVLLDGTPTVTADREDVTDLIDAVKKAILS